MRVLWLSHLVPYPPKGGVLQRSFNLLREAAGRHEVHLLCLTQAALLPTAGERREAERRMGELCASVESHPLPADRSRLHWAWISGTGLLRSTPYDVNWLRSRAFRAGLRRLAGSVRFDLVHADTIGLWPYARELGDVPVVLNHHNVESRMMGRRARRSAHPLLAPLLGWEARKMEALERRACPAASINVVVSELDGRRLREVAPGSRVRVVENGVDLRYFRPSGRENRERSGLVFAGGMSWYPNREAMLYFVREIWPALLADRTDRRAAIVGRDPPPEVRRAAADERLKVPGFVDDVRPWLEGAAIYVCPIRDGGGTRLKVLDALAMEVPLVATRLAVEGLGLEEGRHYLEAESPEDYVGQIARLEAEPALRERLSREGRELVEQRYGWPVLGEKLEAAYREAVTASRGASARGEVGEGTSAVAER